jgi:hypothetical protein
MVGVLGVLTSVLCGFHRTAEPSVPLGGMSREGRVAERLPHDDVLELLERHGRLGRQ